MKFGFVAKHRGIWPVEVQCGALGVSRSGFYAWCERPESTRSRIDAGILQTIRVCFAASDSTYGARRMITDVRAAGHICGRQRVARLMRGAALRARPRRRAKPMDSGDRALHMIAANVLDREFTAPAPNQMAESFFATLECELLDRRRFKTQVEARHAIFRFIEGWYNPHRRHSSLVTFHRSATKS